ncbi:MAG: hypothetical protein ABGY96_27445 [bacterium]
MFLDYFDHKQSFWTRIWTRAGFRHVQAIAYVPQEKKWLLVEPSPGQCLIRVIEPDDVNKFIVFCNKYGKALAWTEQHRPTHGYAFRNCVSMLKDIIGFSHFCLTPYGLYKKMLKAGAKPVFGELI